MTWKDTEVQIRGAWVLTLDRRLSLSSLLSRTRKLGGTYQKQTLVCWGYKQQSQIHAQFKQTSLKIPRTFQICSASRYNPPFKSLITVELPDFHTIIQYLCVCERESWIYTSILNGYLLPTASPLSWSHLLGQYILSFKKYQWEELEWGLPWWPSL